MGKISVDVTYVYKRERLKCKRDSGDPTYREQINKILSQLWLICKLLYGLALAFRDNILAGFFTKLSPIVS